MNNVLDLRTYVEETFDLTLLDGTVLSLRKPTQRMLLNLVSHQKVIQKHKNNPEKVLDLFTDIMVMILNNNKEGIKISADYIAEHLDLNICELIMSEYMKFVEQIKSNPN